MKATIKNLSEGKCAVKNDGTVDELRRVLKLAFPKDPSLVVGSDEYYLRNSYIEKDWESTLSECPSIPFFSVKEFLKEIDNQQTMKNRTITSVQAQSIFDIACVIWKQKLGKLWSEDILFGRDITITESSYEEMRKACTADQHKLFDEIFGSNQFTAKAGDWVVITDLGGKSNSEFSIETLYQLREDLNQTTGVFRVFKDNYGRPNGYTTIRGMQFRMATPAEIKAASWYPHLTPCLVRDTTDSSWKFAYSANEVDKFYRDSKQWGATWSWAHHQKLDANNLPK